MDSSRGEMPVHPEIAGQVAAGELGQVDPVMQDRPQHAIGEAVVIFLVVLLGQIGDDISVPLLARSAAVATLSASTTLPLQPNQTLGMFLSTGASATSRPPARGVAAGARHGHTVGNENQPRQYRSSQLRDRRIAVRIRPAIE